MKRRITSMLLAAAMTITMLTGCGSQGKETEKTDTGAIVLDMYHSWSTDSERGAALDKLIQEFNKEYEGKIEVKRIRFRTKIPNIFGIRYIMIGKITNRIFFIIILILTIYRDRSQEN